MDDFPIDEDAFVFTYPVFFLLDPAPPVSFVSSPIIGQDGHGIHIFTDESAADDYLARNPQPASVVKHRVRNKATFVAKLEILAEQNEFTHLIIDDRGGGAGHKRCVAIKDAVRRL